MRRSLLSAPRIGAFNRNPSRTPCHPIESGDPRRSQKPAAAMRRSLLSAPRIGAFNRNPSRTPCHPIESGDPRRSQKPAAAVRRSLLSAPRIGAFNRNPSRTPHQPIESGDPRRSQKPAAANRAPFDLKSAQDHRDEIEDQEETTDVGGGCQDGTGGEGRIRLEPFQRFVRRAFCKTDK